MALEIPSEAGMPAVKICNSPEEVQSEANIKLCHGFYDPQRNLIIATADSVAHEIGHFRDIKSGRFKKISTDASGLNTERLAAASCRDTIADKMRNELVAILFAFSKCGIGGTTLEHEYKLMSWIQFQHSKNQFERFNSKPISNWTLGEIQDATEWIVRPEHAWRERLEFLFKGYLLDDHLSFKYSPNSRLTKLSSKV